MDESLHNNDLLIRYLDGELSPQEKDEVETRLQKDERLQAELINLQIAIQAVKQLGTSEQVASVHAQMMQELKAPKAKVVPFRKVVRYTMATAASILLLFVGIRLYTASQVSSEKLYDQAFVDFNVSVERGGNTLVSDIEKNYQQKNYQAIIQASRYTNIDAKDSLLIGLSYLHTEQTSRAIGIFQTLASGANNFQQDAEFYLALSYLKEKKYDKSVALLDKIAANPNHLYHAQVPTEFVEKVKDLSK